MTLTVVTALGIARIWPRSRSTPHWTTSEFTEDELKEMAIFLTHYVGFPLGSKLDGAVSTVVRQAQEGREKGAGEDKKANVNAAVQMHSGEVAR